MSAKLIIKSHHPCRYRAKLSALLALLVAISWGVFEYGFSRAGYDNSSLHEESILLNEQLDEEQKRTQDLSARIAVLERAAQVDKQAYSGVETSQKQTQDEMLELKEEVAFIVASSRRRKPPAV